MEKRYGGESPAKTICRNLFWSDVESRMKGKFCKSKFLVLAGDEAGDVRNLYSRGAKHVTAVDIIPQALYESKAIFARHYPQNSVKWTIGDVGNTPGKFDVVFLDWCTFATNKALENSFRIAKRKVRSGGFLALGFSYTRQRGYKQTVSASGVLQRKHDLQRFIEDQPFGLLNTWRYFSQKSPGPGGAGMLYYLLQHGAESRPHMITHLNQRYERASHELHCVIQEHRKLAKSHDDLTRIANRFMIDREVLSGWKAVMTRQRKKGVR